MEAASFSLSKYICVEHVMVNKDIVHRLELISVAQAEDGRVHARIDTNSGQWKGYIPPDIFNQLWYRVTKKIVRHWNKSRDITFRPFALRVHGGPVDLTVDAAHESERENHKDVTTRRTDSLVDNIVEIVSEFENALWELPDHVLEEA